MNSQQSLAAVVPWKPENFHEDTHPYPTPVRTDPIDPKTLRGSVIAVPPLARNADLSLNEAANRTLIRYLEDAGIRSLMYGGNANFYHLPVSEYARTLDMLEAAVSDSTWLLPSVGPDHGRMMDQAAVLRTRRYPAAMLLPHALPHTTSGLAAGVRRFSEAARTPVVLYLKSDNYLPAQEIRKLQEEQLLVSIKYAVVRDDPAKDDYLRSILDAIGPDLVVSGIGERPAVVHFESFGLRAMTSGSVCVAPRGSARLLELLLQGSWSDAEAIRQAYLPLEDCRDQISPIRVLHDAVTLCGVAPMGPMLPLLSNLDDTESRRVAVAAQALRARDKDW